MDRKYAQTFARGLAVLRFLNEFNGTTAIEISKGVGVNRAIVYRLLETMVKEGYVNKNNEEHCYYLTSGVQALSDGYVGDAWITDVAGPIVMRLGQDVVWPVSLATCDGASMLIRTNSDVNSPLARRRIPTGYRMPMLHSASGLIYLAFCHEARRSAILNLKLVSSTYERDTLSEHVSTVSSRLAQIKEKGYALVHNEAVNVTHIALPVISMRVPIATLAIRLFTSAMTGGEAVEEFLPNLRVASREISDALEPGKRSSGRPAAVTTPSA